MARTKTVKRQRTPLVNAPPPAQDIYGLRESTVERFSSGCTLLDCVLGGGWAERRVANIIGDKSAGKTLLAIEACANFNLKHPGDCRILYRETEAAFDESYAQSLGLPLEVVDFGNKEGPVLMVEDVFEELEKVLKESQKPTLYVIDSLDALSDRGERGRTMDQGTYGTKSNKISEWFRRQNSTLSRSNVTLFIVSQVRDAIGVTFGEKFKRSGGRALDFYATHSLWLAHLGQIKKTRSSVERVVGVQIKVNCKKNKVGPPFRKCEIPIYFGYGVEDVEAGLDFLLSVKRTDAIEMSEQDAKKLAGKLDKLTDKEYAEEKVSISAAVKQVWAEIEKDFQPTRKKYA